MKQFLKKYKLWFLGLLIPIAFAAPLLGGPKPLTDYKFWYITREDDGHISKAAIRYYEGAITTAPELKNGELVDVTRYRRTKRLSSLELSDKNFSADSKGNPVVIYTEADFGTIYTDDQLRAFLNGELAKDVNRIAIDGQK